MASSGTTETYRLAFPDHDEATRPYTHVSYGLPFQESCSKHARETFKAKRAYIVASTSLSKNTDNVQKLEQALGDIHIGTWTGIRPHTPWDDLVPIINDMRAKNADLLITLGGGSLTDGAKIIIYALANGAQTTDDLERMIKQTKADKEHATKHFRDRSTTGNPPTVPMIFIPTTLSAGEYSKYGGGTSTKTHLKSIMTHPKMFAGLVILDPALTLTTPEWVWLSTGVRAIDHCVESYTSPAVPEECALAAEKALPLLIRGLLATKSAPADLQARLDCQLAANYILVVLLYAPAQLLAGASHGIGHQLGPLGVGHGETSCILLPAVLKYNAKINADRQDQLKRLVWRDPVVADVLERRGLGRESSDLGDALDGVFRALGMPRSLKEVGVGTAQFGVLARNSLLDPCCVVNPVSLTEEGQVLEILGMVAG